MIIMSVCLSVCLFVTHITQNHTADLHQIFSRMLPVARSSSDGTAIYYVLPVLQMTLYFHSMGPMDRTKTLYFSDSRQVAAPVNNWYLVELIRMQHRGQSLLSTIALSKDA